MKIRNPLFKCKIIHKLVSPFSAKLSSFKGDIQFKGLMYSPDLYHLEAYVQIRFTSEI